MDVTPAAFGARPENNQANEQSGEMAIADFGEFLNLFVAQLKYQDPLSPMNQDDFLAQTAQFSSVEQLVSLNGKMIEMASATQAYSRATAAALIGRSVQATGFDAEGNAIEATGRVVQVDYSPGGELMLGLEDGAQVPYTNVVTISET